MQPAFLAASTASTSSFTSWTTTHIASWAAAFLTLSVFKKVVPGTPQLGLFTTALTAAAAPTLIANASTVARKLALDCGEKQRLASLRGKILTAIFANDVTAAMHEINALDAESEEAVEYIFSCSSKSIIHTLASRDFGGCALDTCMSGTLDLVASKSLPLLRRVLTMQDADGNNAFHVAVLAGNDLAVRLMYDAYELADAVAVGAHLHPLDKRNSQGKKPADVLDGKAFPSDTYICARALAMYLRDEEGALERRTRLMMEQEDLAACVPLGVVPVHKLGMVIGMLRQLPDMVHLRTMSGMTWFHIAAASSGPRSFELMELLADGGLDVNTASYSGRSSTSARARQGGKRPLHIAAYHGSWMGVRRLLEIGADPNCADPMGYTPLHVVCERVSALSDVNCTRTVQALLDSGASTQRIARLGPEAPNMTPMLCALTALIRHRDGGYRNSDLRDLVEAVLHMMGREDPTGDVEQFLHNQHYPYDFDDPQILRGIQQGRF